MVSYENINEKALKKLARHGFTMQEPKTKYEAARLSGLSTLVLYNSGKLLIQGKHIDETVKLLKFLGVIKGSGLAIGSDETLKGDTFGGIVVAGFLADDNIRDKLRKMGVKDSKKLLKPDCVRLANEIMKLYPGNYHVESVFPKEYNNLNLKMDVTKILDMLHEKCYKKLAGRKKIIHIVDLYPGCSVGDIKEKKADSKYLEVAAASVIARCEGLKQIRGLEQKAGFFIPLGSTHVESGLLELKKKSLNPVDFVKMNFKNVRQFFA